MFKIDIDTDVACPHCKIWNIYARVEEVATSPQELIPMGPASSSYFRRTVTAFFCKTCLTQFLHPPGQPNAAIEIVSKLEQAASEETSAELKQALEDSGIKTDLPAPVAPGKAGINASDASA